MPTPIICFSESLRQFAESFRGCFSQRQLKYFVTGLQRDLTKVPRCDTLYLYFGKAELLLW